MDRVVITSGYTQGLGVVCRALVLRAHDGLRWRTPGNPEDAMVAVRAALEPVRIGVDSDGSGSMSWYALVSRRSY